MKYNYRTILCQKFVNFFDKTNSTLDRLTPKLIIEMSQIVGVETYCDCFVYKNVPKYCSCLHNITMLIKITVGNFLPTLKISEGYLLLKYFPRCEIQSWKSKTERRVI